MQLGASDSLSVSGIEEFALYLMPRYYVKVSLCILRLFKSIMEGQVSHEGQARLSEVPLTTSGQNEQWSSLQRKWEPLGYGPRRGDGR